MIVIEHRGTSDILVKIETGDTLSEVAQRLTGDGSNYDALKLVARSVWRPKGAFKPALIYPNDLFAVPRHLMLPVIAVDRTI